MNFKKAEKFKVGEILGTKNEALIFISKAKLNTENENNISACIFASLEFNGDDFIAESLLVFLNSPPKKISQMYDSKKILLDLIKLLKLDEDSLCFSEAGLQGKEYLHFDISDKSIKMSVVNKYNKRINDFFYDKLDSEDLEYVKSNLIELKSKKAEDRLHAAYMVNDRRFSTSISTILDQFEVEPDCEVQTILLNALSEISSKNQVDRLIRLVIGAIIKNKNNQNLASACLRILVEKKYNNKLRRLNELKEHKNSKVRKVAKEAILRLKN